MFLIKKQCKNISLDIDPERRRISLSKKKKSNPQINQQIGNVINMVKKDV